MAFKKQGKAKKAEENNIEVIKPLEKIIASKEEKVICPHCAKIIGTKVGQIYQILDKRLVCLKGATCPHCSGELK